MTVDDILFYVNNMTPAQWRRLLIEASQQRCLACGRDTGCECSVEVDAAKELVALRAAGLEDEVDADG
jgi:hypothetical protein